MQIEEKQIVINGQNITLRSPGKHLLYFKPKEAGKSVCGI